MPREIRKRGKRHKKSAQEAEYGSEYEEAPAASNNLNDQNADEGPSWIVSQPSKQTQLGNPDAPFGEVESDVKTYFKTVDAQIQEWQDTRDANTGAAEEDESVDPNEQKHLFFVAALSEMRGKEKQLATDPECSVTLERMAYSMDDFVRRVFMDSLSGSYEILVKNRFASHVCQTLFTVAKDTLARETRGVLPSVSASADQGELRSMRQLVLDICEELLPSLPSLITDPFASHVVRSLLLLLCPAVASDEDTSDSFVRSKKSAAWKAKQGEMKSIFVDGKGKGKEVRSSAGPSEFRVMARRFIEGIQQHLSENEVRAMAADKVACPSLKLLLAVEAELGMTDSEDSLMDRTMVGLITLCRQGRASEATESDYIGTLLRDATSSHLLETIILRCPDDAFAAVWRLYLEGKLPRLAVHPVANFVVAKALERAPESIIVQALGELESAWNKLIKATRTGVLRVVIERASKLSSVAERLEEILNHSFEIRESTDVPGTLVSCILTLLPYEEFQKARSSLSNNDDAATSNKPHHHRHPSRSRHHKPEPGPLEPKIQVSLLLQSLFHIPQPYNQFIIANLLSLEVPERIEIARSASGSRVYDAFLESTTIAGKDKRKFIMDFIGSYHILADDKLGSRVVDRCWDCCDTYLKEKIAKSLIPQDRTLAASFYGKFFARKLNLTLLQRKPDEWRNMQSARTKGPAASAKPNANVQQGMDGKPDSTRHTAATHETPPDAKSPAKSKKRKERPADEIDALFDAKLGKKVKKAALDPATSINAGEHEPASAAVPEQRRSKKHQSVKGAAGDDDADLNKVLNAISSAPKTDGGKSKHKKRK